MPSRNLSSHWLPADSDRNYLSAVEAVIESQGDARSEDERRARCLANALKKFPHLWPNRKVRRLIDKVVSAASRKGADTATSPASAVAMRNHRKRVIGWLYRLYVEAAGRATTFTLIPGHWEFTSEELMGVDPRALLRRLLADLYRAGAAGTKGWMFVYVHGEYDPNAKVYRLHVHGLCSDEMVPVLDRLRKKPNYMSARTLPDGSWSPVYRRVWVRRKPLYDLPYPLTYLMQSFWPSRPVFINEAGQRRRVRDKRAIPEPFHSQVLLWLDQFELQDLALLIGLRVTREGLRRTSSRR